ncbi:MAG: hypothetical protein WD423_10335 [Rhodothermales bacterium]
MSTRTPQHALYALLAAACFASLLTAGGVHAQASVTVNRLADMNFGDVAAGSSASVLYTDADASVFRLDCSGMLGFQHVDIAFTLPTHLTNGGDTVAISFGSTSAAWSYTNDPGGATAFDPSTGAQVNKDGGSFSIYVWIGAGISPGGATPTQSYSNTFTLDAEIQ